MQDWTSDFPIEFAARRGYNIVPYLAAMTGRLISDTNTTERFLFDVRTTHAELMRESVPLLFVLTSLTSTLPAVTTIYTSRRGLMRSV